MCCRSCVGPTGHPPKTYRVPVPDAAGGPPTVLVYRRVQLAPSKRLGLHRGWKYAYDPDGPGDATPAEVAVVRRTPHRDATRAAATPDEGTDGRVTIP